MEAASRDSPVAKTEKPETMTSTQHANVNDLLPLDKQAALTQLGGDTELLSEIMDLFLDTLPDILGEIKEAVTSKDSNRLQAAAHSLKGAASNICAEPTRAKAEALEEFGKSGQLDLMEPTFRELEVCIEKLKVSTETPHKK